MSRRTDWFKDPECVKLIDFLVEKTKEVKEVISVRGLGEEFKKRIGSKLGVDCWTGRIRRFRQFVHELPRLDTETKVKLMFGLSASVDDGFLRELRKEAEITVDSSNRIIHYKKNGGGHELNGKHKFGEQRDDGEVEEKHADSSDDSEQEETLNVILKKNRNIGKRDELLITDPDYVKFVEFLAEKSKEVKTVPNFTEMVKEFQERTNSKLGINSLICRMHCLRPKIHKIPYLDTETKVRMMFGLSAPVDQGFLRELRKDADVEVDNFNRIIHYKKNGGGLELNGKHNPFLNAEVSANKILEFLAKKVGRTSGIIKISKLVKQLKAEIGCSQNACHLGKRIRGATKQIYESELFDEEMKVRMIFATSTEVEDYALKNLRKNATVVVNAHNRIIEYQSNDGSLYLNKKDCYREKERIQKKNRRQNRNIDESKKVEYFDDDEEDSSDEIEEEEKTMNVTTRSGRVLKRNFSYAYFYECQDDSSSRNEGSKRSNTPKTSNKKRKIMDHGPESVVKRMEVGEKAPEERLHHDLSYQYNRNPEVKLEPFNGPLKDDTSRKNIINNGADFVEEIPAPIENFVAPKYEEMLFDVKLEEPDVITDTTDDKTSSEQDKDVSENSSEDVMGFDKPLEPDSTAPTENSVVPKYEEMDVKSEEPDVTTDPNNTEI